MPLLQPSEWKDGSERERYCDPEVLLRKTKIWFKYRCNLDFTLPVFSPSKFYYPKIAWADIFPLICTISGEYLGWLRSRLLTSFSADWHQAVGYRPAEFPDHHDAKRRHQTFPVHGLPPQVRPTPYLMSSCLRSLPRAPMGDPLLLTVSSLLPAFPPSSRYLRTSSAN